LRPSNQLTAYLYPHNLLDLVDGDCGLFLSGGGETEERERYIASAAASPGVRGRTSP
jgi:hypothetical protein